ncbi:3'-5' exonuclease [Streptomyces sp. NPDC088354]|uniref:3'-5' exonuclease n=1 Tax=unclassified Streptomyces TaxID=2593676 RepID=UPI0029A01AD3|nr:3'-5' exonuclease [Streptomyces sp. MI02-7b]MDX3078236.1 3'-5' exonuclease [Streptomyces sp. MI02-7b]
MLPGRLQARGGFAVVDVEATGSSSRRNRVVELAVVLMDRDFVPQGEFSTLVDPEGPVGPTHIHGIESHHVEAARAPLFSQIAPGLLALLRGRVLVGHNVGCDRAFLAAEYGRIGIRFPEVPELCTMRMAAQREPVPRGLSLRACAEAAGVTGWSAHTALGDARATARLFTAYVREHPQWPAHAEQELARAAGVEWPRLAGTDAAWVERKGAERPLMRNVPVQKVASSVRNGGA